jgi:hypothetical protein
MYAASDAIMCSIDFNISECTYMYSTNPHTTTLYYVQVNTGTCSWFVSLYGDDDASYLEELIIKKKDWPGVYNKCRKISISEEII